ncbi:MAG: right-handed parallel beta-helix repeat-containing protein [Actinobacteria bacterium]|nr:right-handed parallel beta-helix repeat-containing protein [Actinomycetota bacterium]
MRRRTFLSRIVLFVLLSIAFVFSITAVASAATTIYVDDSNRKGVEDGTQQHPYTTIGGALDVASFGDTVFVYKGTYREEVSLVHGVSLQGENVKNTRIWGNIEGPGVGNLSVKNFSIIGDVLLEYPPEQYPREPVEIARNNIRGNIDVFLTQANIRGNDIRGGISVSISGAGNTTFITNNKIHHGFGIFCSTDSDVEIVGNEIYRSRIGIRTQRSGVTVDDAYTIPIRNNNIHHNADYGLNLTASDYETTFVVIGNRIWANGKGGISLRDIIAESNVSKAYVINNLILNNSGPGVSLFEDSALEASIINNTLIGNSGGIARLQPTYPNWYPRPLTVDIVNCILWRNGADLVGVQATYSNIESGDAGEGNISVNPRLDNNYCPRPGSPVFDNGNNAVVQTPLVDHVGQVIAGGITTDFYGNPRIVDGNGDGQAIVDMGACEFMP